MIEKIRIIYHLLTTRTYIILTDKMSVMSMPLVDVDAFNNTVLLAGQSYALHEMRNRIDEVIREHDATIENLHRQRDLREKESKETTRKDTSGRRGKRNTR